MASSSSDSHIRPWIVKGGRSSARPLTLEERVAALENIVNLQAIQIDSMGKALEEFRRPVPGPSPSAPHVCRTATGHVCKAVTATDGNIYWVPMMPTPEATMVSAAGSVSGSMMSGGSR